MRQDPPRTLLIVGWRAEPPSLAALLERGVFGVIDVEGSCSIEKLTLDPVMIAAHATGIPVLIAFEDPNNAHEFARTCAAAKGQIL